MVERVFNYVGGHINDQSDLQSACYQSVSTVNGHQDREIKSICLQTQALSVKFHCLLWDHITLIQHVWALQNTLSIDLFFKTILPLPFVSTLSGINGLGSDSASESSADSPSNSSPSTPSQSYQTCILGSGPLEEGVCPSVRSIRTAPVWFPPEQGSVMYPFQFSPVGSDAASNGDNKPGDPSWGGDGGGSIDGYVVGDEASSPAQHI